MTHEEKTWAITNSQVYEDLSYNHIETDTRLILEASKSKYPIVIRASDTDALVLMCYAHQQLSPEHDWLMKIDSERYVSVTALKLCFNEQFRFRFLQLFSFLSLKAALPRFR